MDMYSEQEYESEEQAEHTVWKVQLTVAIRNYGDGGWTALDAITKSLGTEVFVLDMREEQLELVTRKMQAHAVLASTQENTVADDEVATELLNALANSGSKVVANSGSKVKRRGSYNKAHRIEVEKRIATVHAALRAMEHATANELALLTGVRIKLVYNALYSLHDAKLIGAKKQRGLVKWSAN